MGKTVYKFIDAYWGLIALHERRLKVSKILGLNDPFDFRSVAPNDREDRKRFESLLELQNKKIGIVSFSKIWQEPLLWSHYADSHKGLCLQFEATEIDAYWEMEYVFERKPIYFDVSKQSHEDFSMLLSQLPKYKYKNWAYEEEIRAAFKLEQSRGSKMNFVKFDEKLQLKKVILGPKYKSTDSNLNVVLKREKIPIVTSRLSFKTFKVVEQENEKKHIFL